MESKQSIVMSSMVESMKSFKEYTYVTGYDSNTEWLLRWFLDNHAKNSNIQCIAYDFDKFKAPVGEVKNWFKKPFAMKQAAKSYNYVCWLDLDLEIKGPIDEIFDHIQPNKLSMVEDVPWSRRRGEKWHNSGVVAFEHCPNILDEWCTAVAFNPAVGDQEVLHEIVRGGLRRLIHIHDLPRKFNTLRLDLLDGTAPDDIRIMHWTGAKGKEHIREMIND